MKKKVLLIPLALLLAISLVLVGCPTPPETTTPPPGTTTPPPPGTLKIGMITSITGPMAPGFKGLYDAVNPTQELVNQMGGVTVDGRQYLIEIVVEDDQSSPDGAVAAANKLIGEGIDFIIAPIFMVANKAIAPICEEAKVIRVTPMIVDNTLIGPDLRYSFVATPTAYYVHPLYNYLQTTYPEVKKIAFVMPDDPGAYPAKALSEQEIENGGMEVVFDESYVIGTEDYYPILTKALEQEPDAIDCVIAIVPWAAGVANQARELGFTGPVFCPTPLGDVNLLNIMLQPEYAYDVFHGAPDVQSDKMTPIVKELRELFEAELNTPMLMEMPLCLGAIYPLLQAIEEAQSFDTDKVVDIWENMESIDTIFGEGRMDGQDWAGANHLVRGPVPMSRIADGVVEFEFIEE